MTKRCNELALMLYSQSQDYTFDMTYALDEVTREYKNYHSQRRPFDEILANLNMEIERCEHLAESLRRLPPMLDKSLKKRARQTERHRKQRVPPRLHPAFGRSDKGKPRAHRRQQSLSEC